MKRVYTDYLRDMLDNAEKALGFVKGIDFEESRSDDKSVYAVIRAVEIIGEAARNIPEEIRSKYPGIPWREVAAMRSKLSHEYFGVNIQVVWKTTQEDLPALIPLLRSIIH